MAIWDEIDVDQPTEVVREELEDVAIQEYQAATREGKAAEAHEAEGEACRQRQREHARNCGEALLAIKATLRHGEWLPWLKTTPIPERTAQQWMQMASEGWETVANPQRSAFVADLEEDEDEPAGESCPCYTPEETLRYFIRSVEAMIEVASESSEYAWFQRDLSKSLDRLNRQLAKVR